MWESQCKMIREKERIEGLKIRDKKERREEGFQVVEFSFGTNSLLPILD